MKQIKSLLFAILAFLILVLASGCGKTYELPWDQFCIKIDGSKEIVLSTEDKSFIIDLLNKGNWVSDLTECDSDFVFYTQKQEVRYHSECGTFNDYTNKRSFTVSEEQRQRINEILNVENVSASERKSLSLTIAEMQPGLVTFEYKDGNPYCFYAYDSEGVPYRVLLTDFGDLKEKDIVTVYYSNEIQELNEINPPGEWSVKYEITGESVTKKNYTTNLAGHICISSGTSTINPCSCLLWSRVDNGDGTYSETIVDKYDVVDLVNGKVPFSGTEIPVLQMDGSINYSIQVNGRIERVYLLSLNGREYSKAESAFEELDKLKDGTYYVVLEVLLDGNCDPDAPQNSYRYEDVFCLIVGEGKIFSTGLENKATAGGRDLATLKEECPQYFGLSTMKGLEIYVCSFYPNSFQYRIMYGTNRLKTEEELYALPCLSADEVKTILNTYNLDSQSISIIAWRDSRSSYYYEINEEYAKKVSEQFYNQYYVMVPSDHPIS